jgi:membrane protein YdbS with pleckstrin-like domain
MNSVMDSSNPTQRTFTVTRDDLGTVRIVNDATRHTIAALTAREAKSLSRELRRLVKSATKS